MFSKRYDIKNVFNKALLDNLDSLTDIFIDDEWSYYYEKDTGVLTRNNYANYAGIGIWLSLRRTEGCVRVIGKIQHCNYRFLFYFSKKKYNKRCKATYYYQYCNKK